MNRQTLEDRIAGVVKHVLEDQSSLKKNGHTWAEWLGKVVTPERVMLLGLTLFSLGGRLSDAQRELAVATKQASDAIDTAAAASKQAMVAAQQVAATTQTLSEVRKDIDAITKALKSAEASRVEMGGRVQLAVTRGEFQRVVNQQLIPRLERIERRMDEPR
jgi:hypothetical protein